MNNQDPKHAHPSDEGPKLPRILLVDDDAGVRESLAQVLQHSGFDVVASANVNDALRKIGTQEFEVLLSDLRMPGAGDGLTVVSAMRHSQPKVVTIILSGYPEMKEAAAAILLQADEILVKPMAVDKLISTIRARLELGTTPAHAAERVANILEHEASSTIQNWLHRVDGEPRVIAVHLNAKDRCAHLPQLFHDLVGRLRNPLPLGTRASVSTAAVEHGRLRRRQGYSAAMMVEESRMLQVSIFETLQNNLHKVDFSLLLLDVMAIADEVDSQLAQAVVSYLSVPGDNLAPATELTAEVG